MGVIDIVSSYPDIFGHIPKGISEEEAWGTISSTKSKGSPTQRISFDIHDRYNAVCKLFKLGLREDAIDMARRVLKYADQQQHFAIAQQICNLLVRNAYLFEDQIAIKQFSLLYENYTNIVELEYQSQKIYGDLLYKYERGLEFDDSEILKSLRLIEAKLPFTSLLYHYYYFSCQLMIAEDYLHSSILNEAIYYFEDLYYEHSAYTSVFVNKLIQLYTQQEDYVNAESLLKKYLARTQEGSTPWFRYLKTACQLNLSSDNLAQAKKALNTAIKSSKFRAMNSEVKSEWQALARSIVEKQETIWRSIE